MENLRDPLTKTLILMRRVFDGHKGSIHIVYTFIIILFINNILIIIMYYIYISNDYFIIKIYY